jgi:tellurium resistance protein TerD
MDSSVSSTGDNRTGEGDGDDETLMADLSKVDSRISEIVVVVTIHESLERKQNFGQVRESFIRIYNAATNEEICKYELDEDFSTESVVEFGRLYRRNGQWKFEAIGRGHQGGLQAMVDRFS